MTGAVFTAPAQRTDHDRMVRAHAAAARELHVTGSGTFVWGWQGRTLGRRAGRYWLRLLCSPRDKEGGHLREGTATAQAALPRSVPRPTLHHVLDWTADEHAYRAELTEYVSTQPLEAGGPVLTRVDLPDAWWRDLKEALADTTTTATSRVAVRQGWVDKSFTRFLGIPRCRSPSPRPGTVTCTGRTSPGHRWYSSTGRAGAHAGRLRRRPAPRLQPHLPSHSATDPPGVQQHAELARGPYWRTHPHATSARTPMP